MRDSLSIPSHYIMNNTLMIGALRQGRTGTEILNILECIAPTAIKQQDYNNKMDTNWDITSQPKF